jgi:hypothetical protein
LFLTILFLNRGRSDETPRTNRRRAAKSKSPKQRPPGTMPVTDFVYGANGKRRSVAKYAEPQCCPHCGRW